MPAKSTPRPAWMWMAASWAPWIWSARASASTVPWVARQPLKLPWVFSELFGAEVQSWFPTCWTQRPCPDRTHQSWKCRCASSRLGLGKAWKSSDYCEAMLEVMFNRLQRAHRTWWLVPFSCWNQLKSNFKHHVPQRSWVCEKQQQAHESWIEEVGFASTATAVAFHDQLHSFEPKICICHVGIPTYSNLGVRNIAKPKYSLI